MKCLIIKNQFSNNFFEKNLDLNYIIEHPLAKTMPKKDLPQWAFFVPVPGESVRHQGAYTHQSAIIVEWDSGLDIERFISRYAEYTYYLHTTSTHTEERPKYRVILPLETPVEMAYMRDHLVRDALFALFAGCDRSCLSNYHKLPHMCQNETDYFFKKNVGKKLNLKTDEKFGMILASLARKKRLDDQHKALIRESKSTGTTFAGHEAYKSKVLLSYISELGEIPRHTCGDRYTRLVSLVYRMSRARYPDGGEIMSEREVSDIVLGHTDDRAVRKMITDTYRRVR